MMADRPVHSKLLNDEFAKYIKDRTSYELDYTEWEPVSLTELSPARFTEGQRMGAETPREKNMERKNKAGVDAIESNETFDPAKFFPRYFVMDPDEMDLVPFGSHLENGMRVLIEDANRRANLELAEIDEGEMHKALQFNRWCVVKHLDISPEETEFIGVYEDGTKRKFNVPTNLAWYVQLDSLPGGKPMWVKRVEDMWEREKGHPFPDTPRASMEREDDLPGMDLL